MTERDKFIKMIEEDPIIQRYQKIESIINENKEVKEKINQLKNIQKQLVNAKEIGKVEAIKSFQQRFDKLYEEIEDYPLMAEYLALQSNINDMLIEVQEIIEQGIEHDFNT